MEGDCQQADWSWCKKRELQGREGGSQQVGWNPFKNLELWGKGGGNQQVGWSYGQKREGWGRVEGCPLEDWNMKNIVLSKKEKGRQLGLGAQHLKGRKREKEGGRTWISQWRLLGIKL